MHHTLKFYNLNRKGILRLYMFFASWTRIPLLGNLVRNIANAYGKTNHRAYLLTAAEADELIAAAGGIAQSPCTCRVVFQKCQHPRDNEILLAPSEHILQETMGKEAHQITPEKAREILKDSQRRGLVLSILKCRENFYAICSCCTCCCVPLRLSKRYGIGEVVVRHKNIVKEFKEYVAAEQTAHGH
ncbi:MAG: ferredoxin-like protein [Dehalococcoidales bacterium]|nr:ferredoxin-like protein [Dehalococcoidales bacterium]